MVSPTELSQTVDTSEIVEKVLTTNFGYLYILQNQLVTSQETLQNSKFQGFSAFAFLIASFGRRERSPTCRGGLQGGLLPVKACLSYIWSEPFGLHKK